MSPIPATTKPHLKVGAQKNTVVGPILMRIILTINESLRTLVCY